MPGIVWAVLVQDAGPVAHSEPALRRGSYGLGSCLSVFLLGPGKNGAMARRIRGCFSLYICEVHGI